MVIGLQIAKLHRGGGGPLAVLDSKKSGLFRVKNNISVVFSIVNHSANP